MYRRFTLSDADRFDKNHIEPGRFAQNDRFPGFARYPAQRSGRRGGTNKRRRVVDQGFHAGLIAQNRASAAFRAGVDRQHRQFVSEVGHQRPDRLDEGRLPGTGNPRNPDADRTPAIGKTPFDDLLRLGIMFRPQTLDQGNRLRKDGNIAGQDSLDVFIGSQGMAFAPLKIGIHDGRLFNTGIDFQGCIVFQPMYLFVVFHNDLLLTGEEPNVRIFF